MTNLELEKRVANIETELANLKTQVAQVAPNQKVWWEQIAGTFKDDDAHAQAMKLGREYCDAQNEIYLTDDV